MSEVSDDKVFKQLGARIKQLRKERGDANYEIFAFKHDISRSQMARFEKGLDLKFSSLLKVVRALDVSLAEFFSKGFED